MSAVFPAGQYVVYEPDATGGRRYWQGTRRGSRWWRPGDRGRAGAARFDDMLTARAAVAASRTSRRRLPRLGYEWLPPRVEQLQLIEGT